ncbi:MAG TPA: aminoglycoside phosphotransferase family protein [Ardenticatenaceae bacterium]|nr:aminoglycoside phosphotransferase family protein [Ardenticatenaceae bacterium]
MKEPEPLWQSELYAIVLHPTDPAVLMLPGAAGWELPRFERDGRIYPPHVAEFNRTMWTEWKIRTTVVRCVDQHLDREAHRQQAVYLLENHSPQWEPPQGGRWVDRASLHALPLARPEHDSLIETCLRELESGSIPEIRPPWAHPGWFAEAVAWTEGELGRLGYTLAEPVEQFKTWGISCILRVHTTRGDVYFKVASSLALFGDEPAVTSALAELFPGNIPKPLAVEPRRRWMLLPDFGRSYLEASTDVDAWEGALRLYATIQRESAGRVDELLAIGCLDRRLDRLAAQIAPLLDDPEALPRLEPAEVERLQAVVPRLKDMCRELAGFPVPPALVHGDLHAGNIAVQAGSYVFFDWTDACLAHPFLDLATMANRFRELPNGAEMWPRLRDAYLSAWTDYAPMGHLREACMLGETLGALHQAVSYQHIIAALEPASKPEMSGATEWWLRQAVQGL